MKLEFPSKLDALRLFLFYLRNYSRRDDAIVISTVNSPLDAAVLRLCCVHGDLLHEKRVIRVIDEGCRYHVVFLLGLITTRDILSN